MLLFSRLLCADNTDANIVAIKTVIDGHHTKKHSVDHCCRHCAQKNGDFRVTSWRNWQLACAQLQKMICCYCKLYFFLCFQFTWVSIMTMVLTLFLEYLVFSQATQQKAPFSSWLIGYVGKKRLKKVVRAKIVEKVCRKAILSRETNFVLLSSGCKNYKQQLKFCTAQFESYCGASSSDKGLSVSKK